MIGICRQSFFASALRYNACPQVKDAFHKGRSGVRTRCLILSKFVFFFIIILNFFIIILSTSCIHPHMTPPRLVWERASLLATLVSMVTARVERKREVVEKKKGRGVLSL